MKAKEFIPASKPRNFVAKNQKTAGAGAHKDKKKAEKQGNVKHKKDLMPTEGIKDWDVWRKLNGDSDDLDNSKHRDSNDETDNEIRKALSKPIDKDAIRKRIAQDKASRMNKNMAEGSNPNDLTGYVYDSKNRYLGQWTGQRLVIDPAVWQKWKDENGQDWASGMVGMAKDRIAAGVWKVQQEKQGVAEYGDTAKGQKMLTKVQKRAVDRVVSKKADTDPKYAKKNQDTAGRAWDRMSDKDESIEMERYRDPEDWDEGNTEPPNNFAVYINGKKWKVFQGRGTYADDYREKQHYQQLKAWADKKSAATGKKWTVSITGEAPTA